MSMAAPDPSPFGMQPIATDIADALRVLWAEPELTVERAVPFGDGHSGFTYLIDLTSRRHCGRFVARLSPPGTRIAGPADLGRQGAVMSALHVAGLPVPRILAADSSGLAAGRALLVMDLVHGASWPQPAARYGHRLVAHQAVEFLHRLRGLPLGEVGLSTEQAYSPTADIDRWASLLPPSPHWPRSPAVALHHDLVAAAPPDIPASLVHGDYHYGNLLFGERDVVAVLDWEIATIGDPRLDFGCLAVASLRSRYDPDPNPTGSVDISMAELADLYGIAADVAAWFVAAACLKYAAILGYNLDLHRRGKRPDAIYERLVTTICGLAEDGQAVLRYGISVL
jgi:aminoglycoside phosphotransferase (APT) family kinase protein